VVVVGKTGTAQKIDKATGSYSNIRGWSSFIGFTPPEKPQLLCAVLIDDPLRGEMGATAAAPAFSKIVSQIISHPQLEYAERMLPRPTAQETKAFTAQKNDSDQTAPLVSGMPVGRATEVLTEESIAYEVIGSGQQVDYQVPAQGNPLHNGTKMLLYTSRPDSAHVATGAFCMPDCRGRDLRDAINCVNQKGLVPFVIGAGTVRRQSPECGAFVKHADVCTLFCAFADVGKKL
jgi:hypothetical protein